MIIFTQKSKKLVLKYTYFRIKMDDDLKSLTSFYIPKYQILPNLIMPTKLI